MSIWSELRRALARDTPAFDPSFGAYTDEHRRVAETFRLSASSFVFDRIEEMGATKESEALEEMYYAAHDQIDVSTSPNIRSFVPGMVKNERALRELARQWRDHPDFSPEWEIS